MSWKDEFSMLIKSGLSKNELLNKLDVVKKMGWVNESEYQEISTIIDTAFN